MAQTDVKDRRYDDAAYWMAEALVADGKANDAKQLFALIADIVGSNFRRSAARRLKEIEKQ